MLYLSAYYAIFFIFYEIGDIGENHIINGFFSSFDKMDIWVGKYGRNTGVIRQPQLIEIILKIECGEVKRVIIDCN